MPDWASQKSGRTPAFLRIQYEFFGRFMGYCLYQHCRLDVRLSAYVYKCLLVDDEGTGQGGAKFGLGSATHPEKHIRHTL